MTHPASSTLVRLKKILSWHLGVDDAQVTDDAHLVNDLGADDLDTIELLLTVEEEFGIVVDDEEWSEDGEIKLTVKELGDMIDRKLGVQPSREPMPKSEKPMGQVIITVDGPLPIPPGANLHGQSMTWVKELADAHGIKCDVSQVPSPTSSDCSDSGSSGSTGE